MAEATGTPTASHTAGGHAEEASAEGRFPVSTRLCVYSPPTPQPRSASEKYTSARVRQRVCNTLCHVHVNGDSKILGKLKYLAIED